MVDNRPGPRWPRFWRENLVRWSRDGFKLQSSPLEMLNRGILLHIEGKEI